MTTTNTTITLEGYQTRFDPDDNYEKILFRSGKGLQSTELNDLQEQIINGVKQVADTILGDGDVIRGGDLLINTQTGAVKIGQSSVYIRGSVRQPGTKDITIPITGTQYIGVWLTESVITEIQDPDLRDPVSTARNYKEPGAGRLKVECEWGLKTDTHTGTFYPVFRIENAVHIITEPPPQLDAITTALARFDREANGGSYVVNGMEVVGCENDTANNKQVISITEGKAHIEGFSVQFPYALRKAYDIDPDLQTIINEPITYRQDPPGSGSMRVNTACSPIKDIQMVSITKSKTVTVLRGADNIPTDPLPDTAISDITSVVRGSTTYVNGVDFQKDGNKVRWISTIQRPNSGETYTVTYKHMTQVTPENPDSTGFTVSGADDDTDVLVNYQWKMPRIDVVTLDKKGNVRRVKGIAQPYFPRVPKSPEDQLALAEIRQSWEGDLKAKIVNHAVHTISMSELKEMKDQIEDLYDLVAIERLRNNANASDPAAKKGVFVDPFLDDDLRDQGAAQNGSIIDGELVLPVTPTIVDIGGTTMNTLKTLDYEYETIIDQPMYTGDMAVNPYQAFDPIPPKVTLYPQVDRWTTSQSTWSSPITRRFTSWTRNQSSVGTNTSISTRTVRRTTRDVQFLRTRTVNFKIENFGPNENLTKILFDGVSVAIQ